MDFNEGDVILNIHKLKSKMLDTIIESLDNDNRDSKDNEVFFQDDFFSLIAMFALVLQLIDSECVKVGD